MRTETGVRLLVVLLLLGVCCPPAAAESDLSQTATWSLWKSMFRGGALRVPGQPRDLCGSGGPTTYPLRTTPDNVLVQLHDAYEMLDAEGYLDCLAEEFIFYVHPENVDDPSSPLPEHWGRLTEESIHTLMFGAGNGIDAVDLALEPIAARFSPGSDPVDPSDDIWEHDVNYDLVVVVSVSWIYEMHQGSTLVFQVDSDEVGPAGETLWEIVEWCDLPRFDDTPVSCTSWSVVKALFR